MSNNIDYLHSHSGLERLCKETKNDKSHVLVDEKFLPLFKEDSAIPFPCHGVQYYKVPILSFVEKGGVFKNLIS